MPEVCVAKRSRRSRYSAGHGKLVGRIAKLDVKREGGGKEIGLRAAGVTDPGRDSAEEMHLPFRSLAFLQGKLSCGVAQR
jgi:hypothetical protein